MATTGKEIELSLVLSLTDKMSRVVEKLERSVASLVQSVMEKTDPLLSLGTSMRDRMMDITNQTMAYGNAVAGNAQAAGMQVEEWQKLSYAARITKVEENALTTGMSQFSAMLTEAANGCNLANQVFTNLGITVKDQQGNIRPSGELFAEIAGIFGDMKEGAEKTTLATQLFGNSGSAILPVLNLGKEGLADMALEAQKLGFVLKLDTIEAGNQLSANLAGIANALQGVGMQIGSALIPTINRVAGVVTLVTEKIASWIQANPVLASTMAHIALVVTGVVLAMGSMWAMVGSVIAIFNQLSGICNGVNQIIQISQPLFAALATGISSLGKQMAATIVWQKLTAAAQWLLNASFMGCPVIWIVGAIVAIGAAAYLLIKHWDKVTEFFQGLWDAVINLFSGVWEGIKSLIYQYLPVDLILKHWEVITNWFANLWDGISNIFLTVWESIKNIFLDYHPLGLVIKHWDTIVEWFANLWQQVKNAFWKAWDDIKNIFLDYHPLGLVIKHWDTIAAWFTQLWQQVTDVFRTAWEGISNWLGNLWQQITALFRSAWDGITAWIANLWQNIRNAFSKGFEALMGLILTYHPLAIIIRNWDEITNWIAGFWQRFVGLIRAGLDRVQQFILRYHPLAIIIRNWDAITDWIAGFWQRFISLVRAGLDRIKEFILTYHPLAIIIRNWEGITAWFANLWQQVRELFASSWEAIANWFTTLNPVDWISQVWERVGDFFADLRQRFFDWGKEIIRGLIDGVTASARKAVDCVTGIGRSIAGGFTSFLGINSPSRLFMEYGVNITEGLTGGITRGESRVDSATEGLALTTTMGIRDTMQAQSNEAAAVSGLEGGFSLNYSPTVNITGNSTEEARIDFSQMLRTHRDEIVSIMERYQQNKQRLSFA